LKKFLYLKCIAWKAVAFLLCTFLMFVCAASTIAQNAKLPFMPSQRELNLPFSKLDEASFLSPPKVYHPETWFHYIGGNVSKAGITKDLEAIAKAGFSGIMLFHGQFGGVWPGVDPQITSLSANWDDAVKHTASECHRLGLVFSMNNCPGWATSGGPWIESSNAMRNIVWSRSDFAGGETVNKILPVPQPSAEPWRDYKDVTVLAFPTPSGDSGKPLIPQSITSNVKDVDWKPYLSGNAEKKIDLSPADAGKPYWIEVNFSKATLLRSVEFSSVQGFNHARNYEPGVKVTIQAVLDNGITKDILTMDMPQSNWQDDQPITLACSEMAGVKKYRISIFNKYNMALGSLRLFSAARKNSWESEAAWTLRSIERKGQNPKQSPKAFINPDMVLDISDKMDRVGKLHWVAPKGDWTILRIGHVNSGKQNGPAPKEGTGWEANKLATSGADAHFAGYIGRLSGPNGPLAGGLLDAMLIDSWECHTQTWTANMEKEFKDVANYSLSKWLPALFGYVVKDQTTTGRFLTDWRKTINHLFTNNYYGRMASLARNSGLNVTYETSAGDVLPGDIMEYFKFADVPMAEFWQPMSDDYVGSINFKPIKPTASAARLYGKPRVAAEAFTSFALTWDEHFEMLREVANCNTAEGVTHYVFHTYTHNPEMPFLPPGTSFGAGIGTPFLRGQTWWPYMPAFTNYLSRCTYMLERGKPVSDVLWYLGDELNHKPDQKAAFPEGFKYDYCNPDVLLNRLKVDNGKLVTPEGIQYRVLWLPDAPHMLPETLEKIQSLLQQGATVVGEAPVGLATLSGGNAARLRFDAAVKAIWGVTQKGIRKNGKGYVVSGITLGEALTALKMAPDVTGGDALWLHRKAENADWYFISAPGGKVFTGELSFRTNGAAELWDPVTGTYQAIESHQMGDRTVIQLDLVKSNACFIVFRKNSETPTSSMIADKKEKSSIQIAGPWTLSFPAGWGAPDSMQLPGLKPWKELDLSPEGKAFSGTATYTTTFDVNDAATGMEYMLDLGNVDMVATVTINGTQLGSILAPPYRIGLKNLVQQGKNTLSVQVTSTWFNRLVFDAGQLEEKRKTWTIDGPDKNAALRASGLMGPVMIEVSNRN
jgi:hypothetical protein